MHDNIEQLEAALAELKRKKELEDKLSGKIVLDSNTPFKSAEIFIDTKFMHEKRRTIHHCRDAFWVWCKCYYREIDETTVRRDLYEFLEAAFEQKVNKKTGEVSLVPFTSNAAKVSVIFDAFKCLVHNEMKPEASAIWLDESEYHPENFIVFQDGILDLDEWISGNACSLFPNTPNLLNASYLPFEYEQNDGKPNKWLEFLGTIWGNDSESIETLQEWFGLSLTSEMKYQKIMLIVGPPRSGKGTIARVMRKILGEENVAGPVLSSLEQNFGLQSLLNKTHAIVSDARLSAGSNKAIITERLLSISGSDSLTIDRKQRQALTLTLGARITLMSNELPALKDVSGALVNRYILLPMTKSFLGVEDVDLEKKLYSELPEILNWALAGLKRLTERKCFIQPSSAKEHLSELLAVSSPIRAFIKERCVLDSDKVLSLIDLYRKWRNWNLENGYEYTTTTQKFRSDLRNACPQLKIEKAEIEGALVDVYRGIGLSA